MKETNENIWSLLEKPEFKQWVKEPTEESDYYWNNWLKQNPQHEQDVAKAKEFIARLNFKKKNLNSEEKEEIFNGILTNGSREQISIVKLWSRSYLRYAAAVALMLCASVVFWTVGDRGTAQDQATAQAYITKSTPKGQKTTIRLKDGTEIKLNSNSSVRYAEDYGKGHRNIELTGEAYFKVAKDVNKPFIVKTGKVTTTALGTEFNINTRKDGSTRIILTEGKVKVQEVGQTQYSRVLLPNQFVDYSQSDGLSNAQTVANLDDILWTEGILKFENASVSEIIQDLENWYGVEFIVDEELQKLTYSGEFKNEYLKNILKSMSFSLGLNYTLDNGTVELKLDKI
ncbi:MAG: FecR domain-containing protein [Cyclobacteriaceae bacterium]